MSDKQTVLVVDDTSENIDILSEILSPGYKVKAAIDGERALRIAAASPRPDIILLDVMMPGVDGFEACRRLKADPLTASIPIIFVTAMISPEDEQRGFELGAVDYIHKPVSPPIVLSRVRTQLALYDRSRELERAVSQRTLELNETRLAVVRRLGRAAEFRDNETGLHVIRMSYFSRLIAEALQADEAWAELILNAAPMHDVGKIGIPDRILLKPGKLDAEEWEVMKKHAQFGAEIIGEHPSELLKLSREIALSHHEKWDGSGYPQGLVGEAIPLSGRIVAIADVFDALTSERPYKKPWPVHEAIDLIRDGAGKHFDPKLVPLFIERLPEVLEVKERYGDHTAKKIDAGS